MWSISAASVVDLPEPVGPATRTSPRGLSRARRAGGQAELLERDDLERDHPERAGDRAALHEDVRAEAREPGDRVREVDLPARLERLLLLGREDPVHERADLLRLQRVVIRQALEAAVDADHRRRVHRQVEADALRSTITVSSWSIEWSPVVTGVLAFRGSKSVGRGREGRGCPRPSVLVQFLLGSSTR